MTLKKITGIALLLASSFNFTTAQEVETKQANTDYNKVRNLADSLVTIPLLADRLEISNMVGSVSVAENEALKKEIAEKALEESLEFPAVEIYGEKSMNSPSTHMVFANSAIPKEYKIDLSGYKNPLNFHHVTSPYGRRHRRPHHGVDLKLWTGDPVYAAFDGRVRVRRDAGRRRGYGKYYVIRHPNGLETLYGHLSKHIVKEGDIVKAGQLIGLGGNTGRSFGSHLHFEARFMGIPLNPEKLFDFKEGQPNMDYYTYHKYQSPDKRYGNKASKSAAKEYFAKTKSHTVKKGEVLGSIAKRYGTTVAKICRANYFSKKHLLHIGDRLIIPQ